MKILGIDPGSRITGYGFLDCSDSQQYQLVTSGCIRTQHAEMPDRLRMIFSELSKLIATHLPEAVAIEQIFLGRGIDSALKLGHARGAAIVAATNADLPVFEYSTRTIKKAVTGTGKADKRQMQFMLERLFNTSSLQADAADALGAALCHAYTQPMLNALHAHHYRRGRILSQ